MDFTLLTSEMPRLRKRAVVVGVRQQVLERNRLRRYRNNAPENAAEQDIPRAEDDDAVPMAEPEQEDLNAMDLQVEDQPQLPVEQHNQLPVHADFAAH